MYDEPHCFLCDEPLGDDSEEFKCYGCGKYIGECCNENLELCGAHNPEDHVLSA